MHQTNHCRFRIVETNDLFILIVDEGSDRPVTNDAPAVINKLQSILSGGIGGRRVYCRDSSGRFDCLLVEKGAFAGFVPCSQQQQTMLSTLVESRRDSTKEIKRKHDFLVWHRDKLGNLHRDIISAWNSEDARDILFMVFNDNVTIEKIELATREP